jgi:hypothetical protein
VTSESRQCFAIDTLTNVIAGVQLIDGEKRTNDAA